MNCFRHTTYFHFEDRFSCMIHWIISGAQKYSFSWIDLTQCHYEDRFFNQAWSVSGPQKYSTCGSLFNESLNQIWNVSRRQIFRGNPGIRLLIVFVHDELFQERKNIPLADRCSLSHWFKDEIFHGATYSEFPGSRSPPALNCFRRAKIFHFRIVFHRWIFPGKHNIFPLENCFSHVNCSRHTTSSFRESFFKDELFQAHHIFHLGIVIQRWVVSGTQKYSNCKSFSSRWNVSSKPHICTWGSSMHDELFQAHRLFHLRIVFSTRWIVPGAPRISTAGSFFFTMNCFPGVRHIFPLENRFSCMNCFRRTKYSNHEWAIWLSFFKAMNCSRRTKYSNGPFGYRFSLNQSDEIRIVSGAQKYSISGSFFKRDQLFQAHHIFPLKETFFKDQ